MPVEGVVHALRQLHVALVPGGIVVDTQPLSPRSPVDDDRGRLGRLDMRDWRKTSEIDLVSKVKTGFPAQAVEDVFSKVQLRAPQHIYAFIPKATYARKLKAKRLSRSESERLLSITKVFNEVLRLYGGDTGAAEQFLTRRHPMRFTQPSHNTSRAATGHREKQTHARMTSTRAAKWRRCGRSLPANPRADQPHECDSFVSLQPQQPLAHRCCGLRF